VFCKESDGNALVLAVWNDDAGKRDAFSAAGQGTNVVGPNWLISTSGRTGDLAHANPVRDAVGGMIDEAPAPS
jgi:hypothetical protein